MGRSLYIRFYISDTSGFADGPVGISGVLFFFQLIFSSTDYFQVYLFVEFLGGTIRFEFLDKRDFWTTPAVERYQEQSVGQRRAIIADRYQLDVGLPLALLEGTLYMVLWGERKIAAVLRRG